MIKIRIYRQEEALHIWVEDNGIGFDMREQEKFFRGKPGRICGACGNLQCGAADPAELWRKLRRRNSERFGCR